MSGQKMWPRPDDHADSSIVVQTLQPLALLILPCFNDHNFNGLSAERTIFTGLAYASEMVTALGDMFACDQLMHGITNQ